MIENSKQKANQKIDEIFANELEVESTLLECVETINLKTSLNGYVQENPFGQETKELSVDWLMIFLYKEIHQAIEDFKDKLCPKSRMQISSFVYQLSDFAKKYCPTKNLTGFLNVSNEYTEFAVMEEGYLSYATFIPFGSHTMARVITKHQNLPFSDALSLLKNRQSSDIKKLDPAIEKYKKHLKELFAFSSGSVVLPQEMLLHCHHFYTETLQSIIGSVLEDVSRRDCNLNTVAKDCTPRKSNTDEALRVSTEVWQMRQKSW